MIIVIEGSDNSGKSTLVNLLASTLGLAYVPGEGPPKSTEEINKRVDRYLAMDNVICDRHPCVSTPIYDLFRDEPMPVTPDRIERFYQANPLFIYCMSDGSLVGHEVKGLDHETTDHVIMVDRFQRDIIDVYDEWARDHANWLYRKGRTDMHNIAFLLKSILAQHGTPFLYQDLVGDVEQFHAKFGLPLKRDVVQQLEYSVHEFRTGFMREELTEYTDEVFLRAISPDEYTQQLEKQLDALVDLVYVAIGTSLFHGFDFREAWKRVQRANMMKVRAQKDGSDSKRNSSFDVVKPKGWTPPVHTDLVANNDYETWVNR